MNKSTGSKTIIQSQLMSLEVPLTVGVVATIKPLFDPNISNYTLQVPNDIIMVEILAIAQEAMAEVFIQDTKQQQGQKIAVKLNEGNNKVCISVKNKNVNTPSIYNLMIQREDLSSLRNEFLAFNYTSPVTGITLPYRLYIPQGYVKEYSHLYPLVFFLHGAGECGFDNQKQLSANMGALVWATAQVQNMQETFVLAPQARQGSDDTGFGITRKEGRLNLENVYSLSSDAALAKEILDEVVNKYKIDKNKIYATGLSQGGFGVWNLALTYPKLFAAIVPIASGADKDNPNIEQIIDLPIWTFHAVEDDIIPVINTQNIVNALIKRGSKIKYTQYPTTDYFYPNAHMSWIAAYHNQEMIRWLFSQSKV